MNSKKRVWLLSFRISGNDGVSLEIGRWGSIFRKKGYKVTFVAGELDRKGILIPDLHFNSQEVSELHHKIVYGKNSFKLIQADIFKIAGRIEGQLRDALNNKKPDLLFVGNAFSLPMHFPLSIALARIIEEYNIPTIAKHYDFWWERKRYLRSTMFPFFKKWFPPKLPQIKHVVINSIAQKELLKRFGINSLVTPDCFDFDSVLNKKPDNFSKKFRSDFGIKKEDKVFLQATRIVPRKRIELSIRLMEKLNSINNVLVIAGHSGDEGVEYESQLKTMARQSPARIIFIGDYISSRRKMSGEGRRIYSLWDAFVNADLMVYPTELEGFGNQFVESVYFKKPVILTRYPVFKSDIEPLGFSYINFLDKKLKEKLDDEDFLKQMTVKNFELGKKHFSYEATWEKISKLI